MVGKVCENPTDIYTKESIMARKARVHSEDEEERVERRSAPALNPEAREQELINDALNLAAKQMREGTASSQVITHFLKLGTERERTERELLQLNKELVKAKTEALEAQRRNQEMFENAIHAMGVYNGDEDDYDDEYDDEYEDDDYYD